MILKAILVIDFILLAAVAGILFLVVQPFVARLPSRPPHVDPARLEAHVRKLSVDLYPRSFDRLHNLQAAARYIRDAFADAGAEVSVQDVPVQETAYSNIVARFGPKEGPLLVIGAHYDSHGDANAGAAFPEGYAPSTHTPGAATMQAALPD